MHRGLFVAGEKLGIRGNKLVLEENGTEIDEDDVLQDVLEDHGILLLLCHGENYKPTGGILHLSAVVV